jgi:hypothetical protein
MINWFNVLTNFLWITALAIVLAVISFAHWDAKQKGIKFMEIFDSVSYRRRITTAGFLFCLGLGFVSSSWERVVWLTISFLYLVRHIKLIVRHDKVIK